MKRFLSVSTAVQCIYSRPTVLFLPFLNGSVTRAVTPGLMTQHHAIICVHLRPSCFPYLTPLDIFSPFSVPHSTLSLSLRFTFAPPYATFSFFFFISFVCSPCFDFAYLLYFPFLSPPPPYAMSKACQSEPSRQTCQYCLW